MMKRSISLFGTFGDLKSLPIGGGQTSARRIWHNLEDLSYSVNITNRHRYYGPKSIIQKIKTILGMSLDITIWFIKLLFKHRNNSIAMAIGYGGVMAPLDCTIIGIAKLLGYKTVFYLKGGGTEKMYNSGTVRNRSLFKKTIQNSDLILTEGDDNVTLVKMVGGSNVNACYMPNYIEKDFTPTEYPNKPLDKVNILYFGRIDESKNVKLIVDVFNLIAADYPQTSITIIGKFGTKYSDELEMKIDASPYKHRISRIGHSSHEDLAKVMRSQHIFLFPSNEDREGHSNALNEAMAWGLVPVVSSNNFLPSIVGDPELVVHSYEAKDYAQTISYLIDNNLIYIKSKKMYQRVQDNFVQNVVEKKLLNVLNKI